MENKQQSLQLTEAKANGPVTCLGKTFASEEERRTYFTERLREKLPELRQMEGFPHGEDEDILALSDPPYYTACPNPFIGEMIAYWEAEKARLQGEENEAEYRREPYTADVSEGKNDPVYNAHSYHTKVPYKAIMRYILHYTEPGDIVFDGFAGTGMTGVAAQLCGDRKAVESLGYKVLDDGTILDGDKPISKLGARRAVLNDLSPAATFIAYNYNTPVDAEAFKEEAERILAEVERECGWMYETNHTVNGVVQTDVDGKPIKGRINYTVWSDVFVCPSCAEEMVFWDVAVDQEAGKVRDTFTCPGCAAELTKRSVERAWVTTYDTALGETIRQAKQVPVLINYSVGNKRFEKRPDEADLALIKRIEESEIPYWFPKDALPEGYNTRQPMESHGVTHVHHFYTKRNLWVLGAIWDRFKRNKNRSKAACMLAHSAANLTISKMRRFRADKKGGGPLSGTLYISSIITPPNAILSVERNVEFVFKGLLALKNFNYSSIVSTQSSNYLGIPSNSIDYIFTDPPFGANFMYSELNFLWESWLKVFTNNRPEAIENKVQGKTLDDYRQLMTACFKEAYRVLKPGRWMTVEFSNTKASVWNAIQAALQEAGFIVANVAALDKKQGSFKAVTSTTAVKQDLVISAYKPSTEMAERLERAGGTEQSAWEFVRGHLANLPVFIGKQGEALEIKERTPRVLFDRMVTYHVQRGLPVPLSSGEFQEELYRRFPMRDGMVFLETQVAEYDKKRLLAKEFVQGSILVTDEVSAIERLRQLLLKKPQTYAELNPVFFRDIQYIAKHEKLPELSELLEQNFLQYDGTGEVPSQIHSYLSKNYKDLRGLAPDDPRLVAKAKGRWYVPDPNKQADLEKLRERALLREFEVYREEIKGNKRRLRKFRTEAIRAGFKKYWSAKEYAVIVEVGDRLPDAVLREDEKLLIYYNNARNRLGL
ncbi:DNA methylase [Planifilum fimeticola]|uniref:DNA methylase n=1 Tax=Planifilum fimeticola TaxID=201975 RepID=A0A2T0LJ93_9BACL|nr:DNA methyltransferase [Planifilum fimeticola]PRX42562.1 DNA methylase [Planifilum fimeticola]